MVADPNQKKKKNISLEKHQLLFLKVPIALHLQYPPKMSKFTILSMNTPEMKKVHLFHFLWIRSFVFSLAMLPQSLGKNMNI